MGDAFVCVFGGFIESVLWLLLIVILLFSVIGFGIGYLCFHKSSNTNKAAPIVHTTQVI